MSLFVIVTDYPYPQYILISSLFRFLMVSCFESGNLITSTDEIDDVEDNDGQGDIIKDIHVETNIEKQARLTQEKKERKIQKKVEEKKVGRKTLYFINFFLSIHI